MISCDVKYRELELNNLIRTRIPLPNNSIDFISNDYLNLSRSPNVKKHIVQIINNHGISSSGSNLVCGYHSETEVFENEFCKFTGYPRAIFFNSGYMANLAIFSTLFDTKNTLYADKKIHASMLDGIKLSGCKLKRFNHQDYSHANSIYDGESFIASEGIFSTTGSLTDLNKLHSISKTKLIIDEAHSFGILGEKGKGSINHHKLNINNCPIAIYPLGKAFGSTGAIVCTTDNIAEILIQMARSYIYTTALPAFILSANTIQLENLKQAEQQREALFDNIIFFNKLCLEQNVILDSYDISPIRSIIINNNLLAINIQKKLLIKSIHVGCFRYPTVPRNTSTIRFTIHSSNTHRQIKTAINIIESEINNAQL